MFEHFTDGARAAVADAQQHARGLGHDYIGCEHLLLALASASDGTAEVLQRHGINADSVRAQIIRLLAPGQPPVLPSLLDSDALASIGIDLDSVRAAIDASFGPDALALATCAASGRRAAWRRGPLAEIGRRRHRCVRLDAEGAARIRLTAQLPFTPRAKKCLEGSLREARALGSSCIDTEHLTLALLAIEGGTVPAILRQLGVSAPLLRAAILHHNRKAS